MQSVRGVSPPGDEVREAPYQRVVVRRVRVRRAARRAARGARRAPRRRQQRGRRAVGRDLNGAAFVVVQTAPCKQLASHFHSRLLPDRGDTERTVTVLATHFGYVIQFNMYSCRKDMQ